MTVETQAISSFRFSKTFAFFGGMLLSSLLLLKLYRTFTITDISSRNILLCFDIVFAAFLLYFCFKYGKPALLKQPALVLTNEFIVDHVGRRTITRKNIKDIKLVDLRFSSGIAIYLYDNTELLNQLNPLQRSRARLAAASFGTPLVIPLQYVSGNNAEIMAAIKDLQSKTLLE